VPNLGPSRSQPGANERDEPPLNWVQLLDADPGMYDVLASIPDQTAVPLSEIAHASAESDTQLTPDGVPHWFY
jgi:hypothetical protein